MLLSACMIVRDEARDLPRCLRSLQGVTDEIVVVDTGSRDGTPGIARAAGARVIERAWSDDFAVARNVSLDLARGAWALVIDADEALEVDATALRALLAQTTAGALRVVQRNLQPAGGLLAWRDDVIVRLVRNVPEHRFEGRIHEQIGPSVRQAGAEIGRSSAVLVHHGYVADRAQGSPRTARNLALLEAMAAQEPQDPYLAFQRGATLMALDRWGGAEHELARAWELDRGELGDAGRARCACRLAQLALRTGDHERALEMALAARGLDPVDPLSAYVTGIAAAELGRWSVAHEAFEHVLGCPGIAEVWRTQVRALLRARSTTA